MRISDWSSDVCSSDLMEQAGAQTMDGFAREIARHPEITGAWDVTGDEDFLLKVQVGSMAEYDLFTRRALGEDKGVHSFTTLIALRTIVEDDASRSEEHTSELQSLMRISYAVFCLKKKKKTSPHRH